MLTSSPLCLPLLAREVPAYGIRQLLERKQGLFRMNMMGKRVNHACRRSAPALPPPSHTTPPTEYG